MNDSDDLNEPLFTHIEPGIGFTVATAAKRIAEPGEAEAPVATQLRGFAQRHLVEVRGLRGSGRTAHNLFAWSDLATATILRTLTHLGIADNEVLQAASLACYAWAEDQTPVPGTVHPIRAALRGHVRGEWWQFRLDVIVNADTGKRTIKARVYNADESRSFPMPTDSADVPMASVLLPVTRFADRILQNMTVAAR